MPLDPARLRPYWPIDELAAEDLLRYNQVVVQYSSGCNIRFKEHGEMLCGGSYSYLGLNGDSRVNAAAQAAVDEYGTGTTGVRLLGGTLQLHKTLEEALARFKQTEDAVAFTSGYAANLSLIPALIGPGGAVVCDKLAHASLVQGALLSGAEFARFQHNDAGSLRRTLAGLKASQNILVVIDAVYSMDGDVADLPAILEVCREFGAKLFVDEAHSLGVLGATGHGIEEHFGLPADCIDYKMGTLSKAIPASGGYLCSSRQVCEYLRFAAAGFIYSGALAPASAAAALEALRIIEAEPELVARLHHNMSYFAELLDAAGIDCQSQSAIFPIIVGDAWTAWEVARYCQDHGLFVQAIVPPVVSPNRSRLRLSITAAHTGEDMQEMTRVLIDSRRAIDWSCRPGRLEAWSRGER